MKKPYCSADSVLEPDKNALSRIYSISELNKKKPNKN